MQPTFTQDDLALLREAAGMLMCHLETGSVELTRADMRNMGKEPPAFDFPRLEKAQRARKLWEKLLNVAPANSAPVAYITPVPEIAVVQRRCVKCGQPEDDHQCRHPFVAYGNDHPRREK